MRNRHGILLLPALALVFAACNESGGGGTSGNGTCANTCAKSLALHCPADTLTQDECETSCASQQAACSGQAAAFQAYLDCIDGHAMECGTTTGTPSSPACLSQGLAVFACSLSGGDADRVEGSDGADTAETLDTTDTADTADDADTAESTDTGGGTGTVHVTATVNGTELVFPNITSMVNAPAGIPESGIYTAITASDLGTHRSMSITFPAARTGTFACEGGGNNTRVVYGDPSNAVLAQATSSRGSCTITVSEFGEVGGTIAGTFEATATGGTPATDYVTTNGSFRVNRMQ